MATTVDAVTVDDAHQRITVAVSTALVGVTGWVLTRMVGGVAETVRGDDPDQPGRFLGGAARTLIDTEAPRDVPITYVATAVTAAATESSPASAPPVVQGAGETCLWWAAPVSAPAAAVAFEPLYQSTVTYPVANGTFRPLGRPGPVVLYGVRSLPAGSLSAELATFTAVDDLVATVGRPETMVVRAPAAIGWGRTGRRFVALDVIVGDRLRVGGPTIVGPWSVELPWQELDNPTDQAVANYGATYNDVATGFPTYQAVLDRFPTYDAVVLWVA